MLFEKCGKENTQAVANCVAEYLKEHDIKHIIVATSTGYTPYVLYEILPKDRHITVVTHVIGMSKNGEDTVGAENRAKFREMGMEIVTATHVLSGVERGMRKSFGGIYPAELMAYTLRMFGQGVKVAVECATMALDAGAIPYGEECIVIGGTGYGADTAVLLKPAHGNRIFETHIIEIICKPR